MDEMTQVFQIVVHPELVEGGDIGSLLEALSDFEPVLEQWAQIMEEAQAENFATEGQTFGDTWAELKYSTLRAKRRAFASSEKLVRTGRLQDAIGQAVVMDATSVTTGINLAEVPYAAFQNSGTSRLPARVLVALTSSEVDQMMDVLQSFVTQQTGQNAEAVSVVV